MQSKNNVRSVQRSLRHEDHPAVARQQARGPLPDPAPLILREVRALALEAGADDASVVSIDHPMLKDEKPYILKALPTARSLVALALRMHPDNLRSPVRSVANLEFHRTGEHVDAVAQKLAAAISAKGFRTLNPAMAFPMEMDAFPKRSWIVSHKTVAVAAELGKMGLHRSVIHPQFGSFILLGTVITEAEVYGPPVSLDYNPCVDCKLCIAACPVGAIEPDGSFRFSACYDHNYREFMTGFTDFIEEVIESKTVSTFRAKVPLGEAMTTWQSLAYKPSYKAAYCIAVCPAGDDVLGGFVGRKAEHLRSVVKPLLDNTEKVYVVAGSDAEAHVKKRFPHKLPVVIRSSLRPTEARAFFQAIPHTFQRGPARGWSAVFHFDLSGADPVQATVTINDGVLDVAFGLKGAPDVTVRADGQVWIDIVNKSRNPVLTVLTGKLHIAGKRSLLDRFAACFPR